MRPIWDGKTYEAYRPWSAERKHEASIRAKRRRALNKKAFLEAELVRVNLLLIELGPEPTPETRPDHRKRIRTRHVEPA